MACNAGSGIGDVALEPGDHACGLFFGWLDRDELMVPFFRAGLRAGDRCIIVSDRTDPAPLLRQLGRDGDTQQWLATGQLQVLTSAQHPEHTPSGLDHDEMLAIWQEAAVGDDGPPGSRVRIGGEVSWWTPIASPAEIIHYEAALNHHIGEDVTVLCLYDLSRFSADTVIDAVMTHPTVLVGDRVLENPWFGAGDRPTMADLNDLVTG